MLNRYPAIEPQRIPRAEHPISRSQLSSAALKTLYSLKDAGYEAYIVGGGVRDLLAGIEPKDFDIATNAHPEQIRQVFRNCRLVGRRFLIAHVRFGDEILEVTTFRGPITDLHERDETGRILSDNEYGTLEEDAFRRDFTVNALYYDIRDFSIVDFAGGLQDCKDGVIRLIGDPALRYREDPVRMLRAIRIANKLKYRIEPASADPIRGLAPLLQEIPPARLFDEVLKLLQSVDGVASFEGLREHGLFGQLFPQTEAMLRYPRALEFVKRALGNTAERVRNDQPVSPAFLYAAVLWPAVAARVNALIGRDGKHPNVAIAEASDDVLSQAIQRVAIPKRFSVPMREIWAMQTRFDGRRGGRAQRLMTHPRFRAAYDFLLLRAAVGEAPQDLADWWTQAQEGADLPPVPEDEDTGGGGAPKRRRRRGGRGRKRPAATGD
ncbi:polynucleotide adenylyltransferase PcnB [Solimonas sp. K1W22B-7]|nr:polynucleotide adenylyltransferase PcnB [Solimonas sp. K1W22B-7]